MTEIAIFVVPYDSGSFEVRHGLGPGRLLRDGLKERLEADGHAVNVQTLTDKEAFPTEIATSFRLLNQLSLVTDHMSDLDPGCVKTPEAVFRAQHWNRKRGLGESLVR